MTNEQLYLLLENIHARATSAAIETRQMLVETREPVINTEWRHVNQNGCTVFLCSRAANPEHWQEREVQYDDPIVELAPIESFLEGLYLEMQGLKAK